MGQIVEKKRIEFIDLAKGVCILMVVMGHCGFPIDIPGWEIVRMPLYLFFQDCSLKIMAVGVSF